MTDLLIGGVVLLVLCIPLTAFFCGLWLIVDWIGDRMFLAQLKKEGRL